MHTKIGAILLIAGTCIGSGMIALPIVLAKIGLIPSIVLMLFIWFIMYYTSLINLELNMQAGQGMPLGALAKVFSGKGAGLVGTISLKIFSYSLLAVFISGGSSVVQDLIASTMSWKYSFESIALYYAFIVMIILLLPINLIDHFNRLLFFGLIAVVAVLIVGLVLTVEWSDLPLFSEKCCEVNVWAALIPVVFTSFGFQVIFHTIANYCKMDKKALKQAFFWGSLIPAVVYILWTCSILSVVYHDNPLFYVQMVAGKIQVGELIDVLGGIAKWQSVQLLVWWISFLALASSVIGVGISLYDTFKEMMAKVAPNRKAGNALASVMTVLPAYLVVVFVPNAFITVLGFAGMMLALIAVLFPIYLFWQIKSEKLFYPELNKKSLVWLSIAVAAVIIACEGFNMLSI